MHSAFKIGLTFFAGVLIEPGKANGTGLDGQKII
jgi:hypothetical protein